MNGPALPPLIRSDLAKMGPERREWRCEDLALAAVLVDDFADSALYDDPDGAAVARAIAQSFRNIVATIREEFP